MLACLVSNTIGVNNSTQRPLSLGKHLVVVLIIPKTSKVPELVFQEFKLFSEKPQTVMYGTSGVWC